MALSVNIGKLINKEVIESERIEFKQGWNPEDIMHSLCAFANDINNWGGGYIVVGIEEKDGIPVLPPVGLELSKIDSMQRKLVELGRKVSPNYTPIVSHEVYQSKNILVIYVPGGDARPYKAPRKWNDEKVYWVRKGSVTAVASAQDEARLLELANRIPFDDRINHLAGIEELSLPLIQGFLKEIGSKLYAESGTLPFSDLCRKLHIVRGPNEEVKPLNVGLLLFSEAPDNYFKGCVTEVINYKDEVGDVFEEAKFTGAIHVQMRNVLNYIRSSIIKEKVVKVAGKAESIRSFNYPYEAIEEAIANSFYHRSYEDQRTIEINVRLDRIEIISYPGPLPPLNKVELRKERVIARDYRNRRIGDFLKELKLTEGRGTGFPKIRRSMKQNGSPSPVFETDNELLYFLTVLPVNRLFIELILTDDHIKVLKFCKSARTKKEILEFLGLSNKYENAQRHIKPLVESGHLGYTFPNIPNTPKQRYIITDKAKRVYQIGK